MKFQKLKIISKTFLCSLLLLSAVIVSGSNPAYAKPAPAEAPANSGTTSTGTSGATAGTSCGRDNGTTTGSIPPECVPYTPLETDNPDLVAKYLNPIIKLFTVLFGIAVVIGIIYGGIEYSMSAGDPQKAATGKNRIRNSVIALIAYVLIIAFLNFLIPGGVTGINI